MWISEKKIIKKINELYSRDFFGKLFTVLILPDKFRSGFLIFFGILFIFLIPSNFLKFEGPGVYPC